ncbi:MAG: hypothetical protein CMH83_00530 [Nocardioides sp.]|nr:hypothetical protein [Nocardioides sp.]
MTDKRSSSISAAPSLADITAGSEERVGAVDFSQSLVVEEEAAPEPDAPAEASEASDSSESSAPRAVADATTSEPVALEDGTGPMILPPADLEEAAAVAADQARRDAEEASARARAEAQALAAEEELAAEADEYDGELDAYDEPVEEVVDTDEVAPAVVRSPAAHLEDADQAELEEEQAELPAARVATDDTAVRAVDPLVVAARAAAARRSAVGDGSVPAAEPEPARPTLEDDPTPAPARPARPARRRRRRTGPIDPGTAPEGLAIHGVADLERLASEVAAARQAEQEAQEAARAAHGVHGPADDELVDLDDAYADADLASAPVSAPGSGLVVHAPADGSLALDDTDGTDDNDGNADNDDTWAEPEPEPAPAPAPTVGESVAAVAARIVAAMEATEEAHRRHVEAVELESARRAELLTAQAELDAELIRLQARREAHALLLSARRRAHDDEDHPDGEAERLLRPDHESDPLAEIGETLSRFAESIETLDEGSPEHPRKP